MLTGDFGMPTLISVQPTGSSELLLVFSSPVRFTMGDAVPLENTEALPPAASVIYDEDAEGRTLVRVQLADKMDTGRRYTLFGEAGDKKGNTLSICLPVIGFNDRVPDLLFSEVQSRYTGAKGKISSEFVELYALTAGNLSGLAFSSAVDKDEKTYYLPAAEVGAGEYILIHLRPLDPDSADETGGDLSESQAAEAVDGARDLWVPNDKARIGDFEDVLFIFNSSDKRLLDALLFRKSETPEWSRDQLKTAAERAQSQGLWPDAPAADSEGMTTSRSLSRQNIAAIAAAGEYDALRMNGPGVWKVIDSRRSGRQTIPGATPGKPNGNKIYLTKSQSGSE